MKAIFATFQIDIYVNKKYYTFTYSIQKQLDCNYYITGPTYFFLQKSLSISYRIADIGTNLITSSSFKTGLGQLFRYDSKRRVSIINTDRLFASFVAICEIKPLFCI